MRKELTMTEVDEVEVERYWPTRDDLAGAVTEALCENAGVEERSGMDFEIWAENADVAVEALVDASMVFPADRFDEVCHVCERPNRDHAVDGRHPWGTVEYGVHDDRGVFVGLRTYETREDVEGYLAWLMGERREGMRAAAEREAAMKSPISNIEQTRWELEQRRTYGIVVREVSAWKPA
jgi:hypothetical protein